MTTRTPIALDRARIAELTARESARLDERTPGSSAMYERARQTLSAGVASSYQVRDPWPIYLDRGEGAYVWDVDGNRMVDFHNGFGSMVQGHAHPAISAAVTSRITQGTHFAAPTQDAIVVAEELKARFGLPRWRYVNSGSEATMDAIRIARAVTGRDTIVKIFGSYHGHHDYVMVSIGVPYDEIGDSDDLASLPYGGGIPKVVSDMTIPVPFNDAGAMERRIERLVAEGRAPAAVIMEAAMMNLGIVLPKPRLPGGRAGDHPQARHRPDLRRGQDRAVHRRRWSHRAVRREARHGHAGQGAGRRAAGRGDRRFGGGVPCRRGRHGVPGGHLQREPAGGRRCPRVAGTGADACGLRAPRRAQRPPGARLPGRDRRVRAAGVRHQHGLEGLRDLRAGEDRRLRHLQEAPGAHWPTWPGSTT